MRKKHHNPFFFKSYSRSIAAETKTKFAAIGDNRRRNYFAS